MNSHSLLIIFGAGVIGFVALSISIDRRRRAPSQNDLEVEAHLVREAQEQEEQRAELRSLANLIAGPGAGYAIGKQVQRCRTVAALLLKTDGDGALALSREEVANVLCKLVAMDEFLYGVLEHPALWRHPIDHGSREQVRMANADHGPDLYDKIIAMNGMPRPFFSAATYADVRRNDGHAQSRGAAA